MKTRYAPGFGSSPLARGTRRGESAGHRGVRLIPARAGNTAGDEKTRTATAAHPRSRGEHNQHSQKVTEKTGSSPLARGTRAMDWLGLTQMRLIPARAGNTRLTALVNP